MFVCRDRLAAATRVGPDEGDSQAQAHRDPLRRSPVEARVSWPGEPGARRQTLQPLPLIAGHGRQVLGAAATRVSYWPEQTLLGSYFRPSFGEVRHSVHAS